MTTRLAILADIHANIWALEAVLAHAEGNAVDAMVNLGDSLYGPLKPRATYERLMEEQVLVTIQGNQDRLIYEAGERDLAAIPTLAYVIRDLGEEPIHWLNELPRTAVGVAGLAFELVLPPDRLGRQRRRVGAFDDDLVAHARDAAEGPVGVDEAQRLEAGVHALATGQQVSRRSVAQRADERGGSDDDALEPARRRVHARVFWHRH